VSSRRVRRPVRARSANAWSLASLVERLESRELLSNLPVAQPIYKLANLVAFTSPPSGSFTPAQIQEAYQFNQVSYNGSGETIAIVDAYNDPDIQSDLNTFDTQFNLPSIKISVVSETGGSSLPLADSTGGWEMEESLDVEWAHAMAPGANIVLVEASSDDLSDLLTAVKYASGHANVVSMSWGSGEFSGETSDDSDFSAPGVAFVVASGDSGAPAEFPAASPNVLAVGGTSLTLNSNGGWGSETGWSGSTGGPSAYEPQPSYQVGVVTTGTKLRATPDVAYDASSTGTYAVYDSYPVEISPGESESLGWVAVYGTSAGAPQWSAILAIADEGRVAGHLSALNSSGAQQVMDILYQNPGDFHDITSGTSTGNPEYSAGPGYDYVTGLGTPMVNLVVGSLDGSTSTSPPDTMVVSAPSSAKAGTSFTYTVTAENASGKVDTGFMGTIRLASTDSKIQGLPSTYTFTAANDGVAKFTVTLETAGSQTITETSASGSVTSTIVVSPAAASKFVISGLSTATVGTSESFTVTALDSYGNVATGYTGTVKFTSSDTAATLPGNTPFTSTNAGKRTFSVTFGTAGTQSLSVTDTTNASLTATQSGIGVSPAAPKGLAATAVSSSQINLTWGASAGATGYEIERSLSATSGWAEIGTSTTTSHSDTGLTAGTTYYYQVIATGGGYSSAASNTASATTTGTAPIAESIWGTSFSPTVTNEYKGATGQTFELGVQFESNVAGLLTGVLFYKQRGTTGTNVGHLWSSNGTLLASATFSSETSSGWQEVNFATPVSIQANTIYTASYDTGSPNFYFDSGYFANGGVTKGNLNAPASTTINNQVLDNGVYNYGGLAPNSSQYSANFWVDVVFSPSTSSSASVKTAAVARSTSGSAAAAIGLSGYTITSAGSATPARPTGGAAPGSHGTSSSTARRPSVSFPVVSYRPVVRQARALVLWGQKATSVLS
jgi:hypothetical protein